MEWMSLDWCRRCHLDSESIRDTGASCEVRFISIAECVAPVTSVAPVFLHTTTLPKLGYNSVAAADFDAAGNFGKAAEIHLARLCERWRPGKAKLGHKPLQPLFSLLPIGH